MIAHQDRVVRVLANHHQSEAYLVWGEAHAAISSGCWLRITYKSHSKAVTDRTVFPLGLFYWGGKWTLGCWCELRGDYRDLRVDRITKLELSEQAGVLPGDVSLSAYIALRSAAID
nr:WYL domain-containing protein [Ketobacter sp. MCCC 1A13808]